MTFTPQLRAQAGEGARKAPNRLRGDLLPAPAARPRSSAERFGVTGLDRLSLAPARAESKPHVLLVFKTRYEDAAGMLRGVTHYERASNSWVAYLDDEGRAEIDPRWVRSKRWCGVISRHTTPTLARTCSELGIPLVDLSDAPPMPHVSKIRADNAALGQMGAEYFLERGYRHFAFCGYRDLGWSQERRTGFVEALGLAGHPCELFEVERPSDLAPFWEGAEADALTLWVRGLPPRVAVMACSDLCAFQVMRAAEAAGVLVPEQMGVLGANNDPMRCELANPPISSVAANSFQAGYQAAQHLDELMAGRASGVIDVRIEPLGVVTRKSTDVVAVSDAVVSHALSYIREHACKGVSVDDVLRQVLVSRSKLESRFRRHVGRSPQAEIRRVQVMRIIQLLLETDLPLAEIAELTGFVHVEYMCVLFKRFTGESPGRYRRKHRTEPIAV
ncbi:XylR family transcriptional regulator [Opitutus terrae]|uniref:Transcriptional regulator, AraC family n=1 Tax=Opitutus terrae (strain DSM 11246 / JCM 15787 / PB90-1) TaxID=452637 RepID=B1ZWW6_OPITP|nr:DNA-binding transcriptional regulator [Opitutus terrae]ACB75077.1 transcriptional regulator, AraC family [Opitutus terrae PB90-1]